MYLSHAGHANLKDKADTLQDKADTLQDKVDMLDTLQDKVDTLQDKVVNLEDKLDTFQNTTEASTREHHHEVVELLQNTSCSLDGIRCSFIPRLSHCKTMGEPGTFIKCMPSRVDTGQTYLVLRKNCIW